MLPRSLNMSVHLESGIIVLAGAVPTGKVGRKWACGVCICRSPCSRVQLYLTRKRWTWMLLALDHLLSQAGSMH